MLKRNKRNKILLIFKLFFVCQNLIGQYGSNKDSYFYFYELKDTSASIIEMINISNDLSRKIKYNYIISRELGIAKKYIWQLETKYDWMKYKLNVPYGFISDSLNQFAITNCFDDLLDPFEINISKPTTEFNNILKDDSISIQSITIETNKTFDRKDNYRTKGTLIKDNVSPKQIKIKGNIKSNNLLAINGFFFFDNINSILNDSLINEILSLKGKRGFNKKCKLYLQLLGFRDIEYQCFKKNNTIEVAFNQYQFNVKIDQTTINRNLICLIDGGNILETLSPLR